MVCKIKVDLFEGPLDLLLSLIRDKKISIYDIPIVEITEQYIEYLNLMQELDFDIAGDYLLMAATLTYIKSRELLPKHDKSDQEDDLIDGIDPKEALIKQLEEYQIFKEASTKLKNLEERQMMVFPRIYNKDLLPDKSELLIEVGIFQMLKALKRIIDKKEKEDKRFLVKFEDISVTEKIADIMSKLGEVDHIAFDDLFEESFSRASLVATFLAILELMKLGLVSAKQISNTSRIDIYKNKSEQPQITQS